MGLAKEKMPRALAPVQSKRPPPRKRALRGGGRRGYFTSKPLRPTGTTTVVICPRISPPGKFEVWTLK